VADDFSRGSIQNFKDLNIQPSDISGSTVYPVIDLKHFSNTLKITQGADTVFHLAARVGSINYLHGTDHNELGPIIQSGD
jgi:hypothetical protein